MSVVLIGLPASGKSTVGPLLAQALGVSFVDTDELVEITSGRAIGEIFATDGEECFRALEAQAARQALSQDGVAALGGGAVMNPEVRALLEPHQVVWLDASVVTVTRRVGMNRLRPLLLGDVRQQMTALAQSRLAVYKDCATWRVDAQASPGEVVATIMDHLAQSTPSTTTTDVVTSMIIRVEADRAYDVVIGRGVVAQAGDLVALATRTAIIHPAVMATTATRLAATVPGPVLIQVPDAEQAKTTDNLERCWRELARHGFTRSDVVIGLGGGTTTDLAGFVAATMLRGLDYVCVPTTVLGMADAGVGGKTGINLPEGKNLVGAFWEPRAVLCDLDLLASLPPDQVRSGLGEVVKCGLIGDEAICDIVAESPSAVLATDTVDFAEVLTRSIRLKAQVVTQDLRETDGVGSIGRAALNYGHTFGHAIEQAEKFTWSHGAAVAVGMVFAAEVAARVGLLSADDVARHRELLASVGLPTSYDGATWSQLRAVMSSDKKARGDHLRLVLLDGLGHPVIVSDIDEAVLAKAYDAIRWQR